MEINSNITPVKDEGNETTVNYLDRLYEFLFKALSCSRFYIRGLSDFLREVGYLNHVRPFA